MSRTRIEHFGIDFAGAYARARELRLPNPITGHTIDPYAEHYPVVASTGATHWNVCYVEGENQCPSS